MNIEGTCDPRFAGVRDAFATSFAQGLEHGGGVSVVVHGKTVVDLWGGHADAARTRPWRQDTLVNVWSCTKGVVALAIAMLVERCRLDYAAPVARYWPEFAAGGKDRIPLDLVMSHQAGLNGLSVPMDETGLLAWTALCGCACRHVTAVGAGQPLHLSRPYLRPPRWRSAASHRGAQRWPIHCRRDRGAASSRHFMSACRTVRIPGPPR